MQKIKSIHELEEILDSDRKRGLKIVHCHGVYDLIHPGHIRHFRSAKNRGDKLLVSVTPDRFVNKGPGRPVFPETLRVESIAALGDVDYVVLNDSPDAVSLIGKIRPHLYVKGSEYREHDITGKITEEINAIRAVGGDIFYTDEIVFSSSSLLNRHFDTSTSEMTHFLRNLKYTPEEILQKIDALRELNVLVIGDAIVDEYQFVESLGQSGKGHHMVARCLEREVYLGGSLIMANHLAQYTPHVTLITGLGKHCPHRDFIQRHLDPRIQQRILFNCATTLTKKRYVIRDGTSISKLFETYSGNAPLSLPVQIKAESYDLVLVCDFGNGFISPTMREVICDMPHFLGLNTQTNSGNRGFNVITNYRRADYISLNEPELRLAMHDKHSPLEQIASDICRRMNCKSLSVTQGVHGVFCFSEGLSEKIPALAANSVDRIGAGDSFFALSSLCRAKGYTPLLAGFIGSAAAAMSVQMVGNEKAIQKVALCKFIARLLK